MDLREELIQGLLKEYAALGRIREKLAIQLEALGVDVVARETGMRLSVTATSGWGGGGSAPGTIRGGSGGGSLNA